MCECALLCAREDVSVHVCVGLFVWWELNVKKSAQLNHSAMAVRRDYLTYCSVLF